MKESSPNSVALHFGTCAAFALAAAAAPFVPEAIAVYAGYRYLRGFTYRFQQWHAPARVPLHVGNRAYRDATTRNRGTATWPIGTTLTDELQIWLRREDLRAGSLHIGRDPVWLRQTAEAMTFGACLNQMGVLVVDDWAGPSLSGRLRRIAAPFGRDAGFVGIEMTDPFSDPLRITPESIVGALRAHNVSGATIEVVEALAPVLLLIGRRYALDPLSLYPIYLREEALSELADGRYEINGNTVDTNKPGTSDGQAFLDANFNLRQIDKLRLPEACAELAPFVDELLSMRGLSLNRGYDLKAALGSGRMTYIRPCSTWTRHIVIKTCIEALDDGQFDDVVIHVTNLESPHYAQLEVLRAKAYRVGATTSFAVLDSLDQASQYALMAKCVLQFRGADEEAGRPHFIESKVEGCKFGLEYQPLELPRDATAPVARDTKVKVQERAKEALGDAPMPLPSLEDQPGSNAEHPATPLAGT